MNKEEVQKLNHGLYKVKWKKKHGGGSSLASVGSCSNGDRWLACCNWVSGSTNEIEVWEQIKNVKLIKS